MAFSNKKQLNSMVSSIQSLEDTIETKQDLIDDNTNIKMPNLTCDGLVLGDLNVVTKLNELQSKYEDLLKRVIELECEFFEPLSPLISG
jgi:hypothetical protein